MAGVSMPLGRPGLLPRHGQLGYLHVARRASGIAGRLAYSSLSGLFSLSWDEAETAEVPGPMAAALAT